MRKYYDQKTFKISETLTVECQTQNTNYGFRHLATLYYKDRELVEAKVCYYNRTWEAWNYQTVILEAINKAYKVRKLSDDEKSEAVVWANGDHTDWSGFRALAGVMALGNILGDSQKEKNDWKTRMLKAGLGNIIMPDDWDGLTEEEKETRLNKVMEEIK